MTSDLLAAVRSKDPSHHTLDLRVGGMSCASCVGRVRDAVAAEKGEAYIDLTSGLVSFSWEGAAAKAETFKKKIEDIGYTAAPFVDQTPQQKGEDIAELALDGLIAGIASVVLMLLAMAGPSLNGLQAAIAVATLVIAGEPFFAAAGRALRSGQTNMETPISLALLLTVTASLVDLFQGPKPLYFDSAIMLLFVLLLGRYVDYKTRGKARAAASQLLSVFAGTARVLDGEKTTAVPLRALAPGMILSVAAGEKIGADGEITQGSSEADASMLTGETLPIRLMPGQKVFAGMVNLAAPIHVRVAKASEESLLSEVIRLMQKAEQSHARFVRLADRVARLYTPIVLGLAVATFALWRYGFDALWQNALLTGTTVLIITCPCAMGLAVPAVQVLASARLFKNGILLKAADALEKLASVDTVVFDKTGTLTLGKPKLVNRADITGEELKLAASLATQSRHPLSQAVCQAYGDGPLYALTVSEEPGQGLEAERDGEVIRLGRLEWAGPTSFPPDTKMELWLRIGYKPPRRLAFTDTTRPDALAVLNELRRQGYALALYSGDRESVVAELADELGFTEALGLCSPADKCARIDEKKALGHSVFMVGDGLNDAAALASANVSLSPSTAMDITQNAADLVFQGEKLAPVLLVLQTAKRAEKLVRQNIALAVLYNVIAVPFAIAGHVSPFWAATAMSLSSLTVVLNAQRMRR